MPVFVDEWGELEALADQLRGEAVLALDTEFIREASYIPRLELVQVATASGQVAIIDYGTLGFREGDPFAELLLDPKVLKVMHASDQDLEMLQLLCGGVPGPVWDTQLALGIFGYNGRTGYQAVCEALLNEKPPKGETLTDWSRRPLTEEQLAYAAADVAHLLALHRTQTQILDELGRTEWALEEAERVRKRVAEAIAQRADRATMHQRVKGWAALDRRALAVLRELAWWREDEARRRDKPRGSVMKDELLIELARRAPTHVRALGALRGLRPNDLDRHGEAMVAAVGRGRAVPLEQCPEVERHGPGLDEAEQSLAALLQAVLGSMGPSLKVNPTLVATVPELHRLVEAHREGRLDKHSAMKGWRGTLVGDAFRKVLAGEAGVRWDPEARALALA